MQTNLCLSVTVSLAGRPLRLFGLDFACTLSTVVYYMVGSENPVCVGAILGYIVQKLDTAKCIVGKVVFCLATTLVLV